MKERYDWLDSLKFIGMLYIYIGHLGAAAGKLYPFVFSFHVPLFFFMSGLLCPQVKTGFDVYNKNKKSFKSIIIPYFIFSLIGIAFLCIKNNLGEEQLKTDLWQMVFGVRNEIPLGSLWFLPCLFVVILYHSILEFILKNRVAIFVISFLIYINTLVWWNGTPSLFFNVDSALHYLSYFSFGAMLSIERINAWVSPVRGFAKCMNYFVLAGSLLVMSYVYFHGMQNPFAKLGYTQISYAFYFFVTIVLFIPSIALAKVLNFPSLMTLGKNSILLCGTEQILKLSIISLISVFGMKYTISDPMDAVLFTAVCFVVSYFSFLKVYRHFKEGAASAPR